MARFGQVQGDIIIRKMNKRRLHHFWTKIRSLNYWYIFAVFLLSSVVAVYALRQNNLTMIRLREAVAEADKNNGDVESALRKLREHVHAHMNTDLASGPNAIRPPIQLKYRYERLAAAEKARVTAVNERIYTEAQAECERQLPTGLSGGSRVACIERYVTQHGAKEQPIPEELYKFDFVSPRWSPDLAGWSLLVAIVALTTGLFRLGLELWVRTELKRHA